MLRAVLVGLLAVSATSSCRGGSDPPKVAPGAVAGNVLEVAGSVAALRGGVSRALTAGAEVFADDVIDTANGSVQILLRHNNARWSVESGQRTRVDQSLAWKLEKQAGPAPVVDHASSAAGREGERTAADTRATSESAESSRVMRGSPPTADDGAPAADTAKASGNAGAEGAGGGAAAGARERAKGGPPGAPAPAPAPVNEKKRLGAASPPSPEPESAPALAPPPEVLLREQLETRRAELGNCAGKLALTLVVRVAKGAPTIELRGGAASAAVRACLERVVKQIPMAGLTASATIELAP